MKKREDELYSRVGIYGIRNKVNGMTYVGRTNMNFGDRRDSHFSLLKNNKHNNTYLQRAWNKYGEENFEFVIIHELQSGEDLNQLEIDYIAEYKNKGLAYNISDGGEYDFNNGPMSEETKRKIGEKNRVNMLGKKASEETRKKMSESHKQLIANMTEEEQRQRIAKLIVSNKGKKWDQSRRDVMSEEQKTKPRGAKYTIEDVRRIRYLHEKENKSYLEIANIMNIPRMTVYQIATYNRWKNAS